MSDNHESCGEQLRELLRADGIDAHVTTVPPLVPSPYERLGLRCPHGVLWHAEPTGEQIAAWNAAGIA